MKLFSHFKFELLILFLFAVFNYIVIYSNASLFREIYVLCFLFFIPGLLLSRILLIRTKNMWEYVLLAIGLSISFLLFGGLIENSLFPVFSIRKPLEIFPLLYFFDGLLLIFLFVQIFLPKRMPCSFSFPILSLLDRIFIAITCLFPLFAVFGAISLNNGGSNLLTMILLVLIPVVMVGLIFFEEKLSDHTYYWYILLAGISLLLMLSLRSWHIAGWDINDEYRIFQLTKTSGIWNPTFQHAYNACLSLTIFPTIISRFTLINDEYIYKIVMQLLFGLSPVIIYSLYKNFSNRIVAFLAVFYIIAQPFFIQSMTGLIRQEVAFFFFALTLYAVFCRTIKKQIANFLFIIFGMSMIVSHYSTAYTTMGLFIGSYTIIAVSSIIQKHTLIQKIYNSIKNLKFDVRLSHGIQAIPLLILMTFTYFWFFQFTQTSGNLTTVVENTANNFYTSIKKKFSQPVIKRNNTSSKHTISVSPMQSDETRKALEIFGGSDPNTRENIKRYVEIRTLQFEGATIPKYNISLKDENFYPVNPPDVKSVVPIPISHIITDFLSLIKLITKIIIFLGPLLLILKYLHRTNLDAEDKEFIILTTVGVGLVVLIIASPTLGQAYNLPRAYLQVLFIAALGGIVFILNIIPKIAQRIKYIFVSILLFLIFFLFSGFSNQFIGGFAYMHLNNFGEDYDKFYTHDQEVYSAEWFAKYANKKEFVFTDEVSGLRLLSFANFNNTLSFIVPSAMYTNSYIYARYANITRLRTDATLSGVHLDYSFPMAFLNENKNLIYNNGGSRIYR